MPFHPYKRQVPTGQRQNQRHSPHAPHAQSCAAGSSSGLEPVGSASSFGALAVASGQAPAALAQQRDARYGLQPLHYLPGESVPQADGAPSSAGNAPSMLPAGSERDAGVTTSTDMSWEIPQYMFRAYLDDFAAESGASSMTGLQYGAPQAGPWLGSGWESRQQQAPGPSTSSAPQHEQRPHPLFDHEETQATKTETVDPEQKYLLDVADSIIREVKDALPFGSANHIDRHPGAFQRVNFAYGGEPAKEIARLGSKPRRQALIAAAAQAGNCDQMATVAYTRARIKLGPEYLAQIVTIPGHTFCRIGKGHWPDEKCVVVDPWPKYAYAVIGKDHFSHGQPIARWSTNPGKGSAPAAGKSDRYAALVRHAKESWRSFRASTIPNPEPGADYTRFNVLYPTPRHSPFRKIDYRIGSQTE